MGLMKFYFYVSEICFPRHEPQHQKSELIKALEKKSSDSENDEYINTPDDDIIKPRAHVAFNTDTGGFILTCPQKPYARNQASILMHHYFTTPFTCSLYETNSTGELNLTANNWPQMQHFINGVGTHIKDAKPVFQQIQQWAEQKFNHQSTVTQTPTI